MPSCKCPGEALVGSMRGFNGDGRGQTEKIAVQDAYSRSGLTYAYLVLARLAFEWKCAGNCTISTRFSIVPAPQTRQDPATRLWTATMTNATLKVWVICQKKQGLA
jgi:hypothetical protein